MLLQSSAFYQVLYFLDATFRMVIPKSTSGYLAAMSMPINPYYYVNSKTGFLTKDAFLIRDVIV